MRYAEFFQLEHEPFSNAPSDRFYFNSEQHDQALMRLMYAIDSDKGLAVLIGGVGTGKTTLARRMLDNLNVEHYESSLLVMIHSAVTPVWILSRIALQLGVKNPESDPLAILKQLYERLLQIHEQGRKAVVLIDEAQMLQSRELMEEFRGLLNLEIPEKKLLNVVFFGLAELEQTMKLDEPLAQRIAVKYTLKPLSAAATRCYVSHRLRVAGSKSLPFEAAAIDSLHRYSGGVPRLINTLADNAMFESYMRHEQLVQRAIVDSVAADLGLHPQVPLASAPLSPAAQASDYDEIDSLLEGLDR